MTVLIIVNDAPYGSEKAFNALRLTSALQQREDTAVRLFLLSDGVFCALPAHQRPEGSYSIEEMLRAAVAKGATAYACMTCLDHRGLWGTQLAEGVEHGSMVELAEWVATSDRVVSF
jgi:uncharacterized protein involved in oxidation of intracellular sulfur